MIWLFITYALLLFLTAFLGGLLPLFSSKINENHLKLMVSLGAGLLIGISFVHMIPEASEYIPHTFGLWFLLGFVLLLVLERFFMVHACEEDHCDYHTVGLAAFVGIAIHATIEGIALASALYVSGSASIILLAILIHKAPTALALTSILKLSGKTKNQIIAFTAGIALSSPTGMVVAYFLLRTSPIPNFAGALIALSAGTFLYIGACDLLPEVHKTGSEKGKRLVAFLVGIGISLLSVMPHHHH